MEPDDSAETASSQFSKQDKTKQDETLGLSSAAGKHSSYSNVKLSQITSSMEPSVQLPVGSLESMDRELGRRRTDLNFLQQLPVLSRESKEMAFQLGPGTNPLFKIMLGDSEMPMPQFEEGQTMLPGFCLDLHAKTYDPNPTIYLTITEFCLWHVSASKTDPPSLITRDADELISYLNGMSLIETLQCTSRKETVSHEERHRIEAAAGAREHCWDAVLYAIEKCQSLRKLQMFGSELKIAEVHLLCQSLLRSQVEDLTLGSHEDRSVFGPTFFSEGVSRICKMVAMNHNLKHLSFHGRVESMRICAYFGCMLATNPTLESLRTWPCDPFGVEVLLQSLTGDGENLPLNTTLKCLAIDGCATKAIVAMLATNNSLTHLTLYTMQSHLPSKDVCMIVRSLKTNKSLQKLAIMEYPWTLCDHDPWGSHDLKIDDLEIWDVQGRDDVFAGIMDLLQVNPWLKDIDIRALNKAHREAIKAQLATNLEIVEKMDDIKTSQQIPIEGEVSQRMQEINLFTNLEASVANLKEEDDISLEMGEETNVAPTLAFSSTNISPMLVQWVQQAFNLITKSLKIVPLLKVHQSVEDGTSPHEKLVNVKQRLENASKKSPGGIIVATEIQPHQERIKFLFANPQGMASTVGVGLDYAVVFWTQTNEILVEGIEEEEWLQLWTEAFTKGGSWHESIITYMLKCDAAGIVTADFECDQILKDIDSNVTFNTITRCARQVCVLKLIGTFFMIARFLNYDVETHLDNSTEDSNLMGTLTSTCLNLGKNFEEETRSNNCKLASNIIDESRWLVHPLQDLWSQILRIDHGHVGDDDSSSEDGKDNDASEENNGGNNNQRSGAVGGLGGGGDNGNEGGRSSGGHSNGGTGGGSSDGGGSSGGGAGGGSGGSSGGGGGSNGGGGHGGPSGGNGDRSGVEGNGGVSGGGGEDGDVVKSPNFNSRNLIAQKAIVKVEPGPASGYWIMDRKNQTRIQDLRVLQDAHLQEVRIEPRMSFEFAIDTDGIKTIQTSISVNFDLEGAMPDVSETNRFGWFQREVIVSLKCSNVGGAKIGHGDWVLEEGESQKNIFKENAQRTSGTNQYSIGGKASGGIHMVQLEGHGGFSKSTGIKASLQEHATEVPLKQIPGGFVSKRLTSGCSLSWMFSAANYPTDITQVADGRSRNAYMNSVIGLCATLCPKIMGSWYELREESDSYLYTFKAQRTVCELKTKRNVLGQVKSNCREFDQVYEVQIHVNHKMTHICKFKPRAFALKAGDNDACSDLLRVGEIHQ